MARRHWDLDEYSERFWIGRRGGGRSHLEPVPTSACVSVNKARTGSRHDALAVLVPRFRALLASPPLLRRLDLAMSVPVVAAAPVG